MECKYVIPLRKDLVRVSRHRRAKRAVSLVRDFVGRHAKVSEVKVGQGLNEFLWSNGLRNPPGKVSVTVWVEDDVAKVELEGLAWKDAVKPEPKKEDEGLKGKISSLIKKDKSEESSSDKSSDENSEKSVEKSNDSKKEVKKDSKPDSKGEPAKPLKKQESKSKDSKKS